MTKIFSLHSVIRMLSVILAVSLTLIFLLKPCGFVLPQIVFLAFTSACMVGLMFPSSCANLKLSAMYSSGAVVVMSTIALTGIGIKFFIISEQALLLGYLVVAGIVGVAGIGDTIRTNVAWKGVELFAKMLYACFFLTLVSAGGMAADDNHMWGCAAAAVALYLVLYSRNWFAVTMLFPARVERCIRILDRRDVRSRQEDHLADKSKLSIVYERAVEAVVEKKLFLLKKYSLEDLSKEVFCNKTFLSRAVNAYSGKGFCYFMNSFRVKHAMDLLDENPKILVKELAFICGFNNVVTFNMAFKAVSGQTPSEYVDNVKANLLRLSRKEAQVR